MEARPLPGRTTAPLLSRRTALQLSLLGSSAAAANAPRRATGTACIVFFLDGGQSHHDTIDPKPQAPAEVRGEFAAIDTTVPGIQITDQLPLLAQQAEHYSIVRSLFHGNPSHAPAEHQMLTGWMGSRPGTARAVIEKPSLGSVVSKLRGSRRSGMPPYVAVPWSFHHEYGGSPFGQASYLGAGCEPFESGHLPKSATQPFEVPALTLQPQNSRPRLRRRRGLLEQLDRYAQGNRDDMIGRKGSFWNDAHQLLLDDAARQAFDLTQETSALRAQYGPHEWGQAALLSRRLVEAGVTFVMLQCGLKQDWDTHDKNFPRLKDQLLPPLDRAVSTLLTDLRQRGLEQNTLVLVMGEFGRTPKVNAKAGRDHWAEVFSALLAGGGLRHGQVIGASDRHGAYPADRPYHAHDLFATMYHALGIDPHRLFYDRQGRPIPVLAGGQPIPELLTGAG